MKNWRTEIHFKETSDNKACESREENKSVSSDCKNKNLKKANERKHCLRDTYRQGDIVIIDFGKSCDRGAPSGKRPGVIISKDDIIKNSGQIQVIPLYRSEPGKPKEDENHKNDLNEIPKLYGVKNILISKKLCNGLHYDMYLQPVSVQSVSKFRIQRKVGRIREKVVLCEIANSIWNAIGREFTEKGDK